MELFPVKTPLRVLVVDDCVDTTTSLVWLLQDWGFEAEAANNGPAALRLASAFRPDAVVLDLLMPCMDGWTVAGELRKQAGLKDVFVVIMSGFDGKDGRASQPVPWDLRLRKPFDPEQLHVLLMKHEKEIRCHVSGTAGTPADQS